jgi:putative transcriptional regulator
MNKRPAPEVVCHPRGGLPPDKTDWRRLDAMRDAEVVAAVRSDPDAQPLTPAQLARMRRVPRVKVVRQRLGMTQAEFAEAFHLPLTALRDWEQHRSVPDAPARALLLAIERDPGVMRRLLAGGCSPVRRRSQAWRAHDDRGQRTWQSRSLTGY